MRFCVLGPISVWVDDRDVAPARGRERALLATLLANVGGPVPPDSLVEALWGESAPTSALHAVEVYVTGIRARLGHSERAPRVVRRAGGYELLADPREIDTAEFLGWCERARTDLAAGDPEAALDGFRRADSIWRGRAFGELADRPLIRREAARLDGLRAAARSERIEAALQVGRPAEAIADIDAALAGEPWHEGLHAQLMLALYRDGRQADALAAYARLRRTLDTELGIQPGPAIEQLQLAILRQDPLLLVTPPVGPSKPSEPGAAGPVGASSPPLEGDPARSAPTMNAVVAERRLVSAVLVELAEAPSHSRSAAGQDPERLRRARDRHLAHLETRATRAGAVVEPLPDGAAVLVLGSARAHEDHALRAQRLALDVRASLAAASEGASIPAIGVDSGEIVVPDPPFGSSSLVGDLASLRSVLRPGEILVGERVTAATRGRFELGPPETRDGARGPVQVRRLIGPSAGTGGPGGHVQLVGRRAELEQLDRDWARARDDGEARITLVVGEAGVGKSALVRAWTASLDDPLAIVARGRCLAYGQGISYWPVAEVLRDRLGIAPHDSEAEIIERLGEWRILGLALGLDVVPGVHPVAARQRHHAAWVRYLEHEARQTPVVLVLEDLHWAEAPLIDLVASLAQEVRGPLLLLATARPEFPARHPGWPDADRRGRITRLEPLDSQETAQLVELRLGATPPDELDGLVERAEGNPFFIEELLATLIDQGRVIRDPAGVRVEPGVDAVLPDSIRSVLAARLDAVPLDARQTLQVASVIGRRFDRSELDVLLGRPALSLGELVRRDFVRRLAPDSAGGEPFAFKHALTRDAAYRSLTIESRARLHAALARHLEASGTGSTDHAAMLSHHFAAAVDPDAVDLAWDDRAEDLRSLEASARHWSIEAARTAVTRYAIEEAIPLLERALSLHPSEAEVSAIWLEIGRANILRYDGVGFWTAMTHAIDHAATDAERGAIYAELAFETAFRWAIWTSMPERQLVDGWIARARELAAPGSRAAAYAAIAGAYWHPLEAAGDAALAIELAERLGDPVALSYALDAHALCAFMVGDDLAAHERWTRRASIAREITDLDHLEDLYGAGIAGNVALGRFDEARRFAQLHDEVAMQLSRHHQLHAVAMHVELEELAGGWARIADLGDRVVAAVEANLATPCVRNQRSLLTCALAASRLGRADEADRFQSAADRLDMHGYESVFNPVRIRLAIGRGDLDTVRRLLPLSMPPPTKNWWRLTTIVARLEALVALGDRRAVEAEADRLLVPGTLLRPYAEWARASVTGDGALRALAEQHFSELGISSLAATVRRPASDRAPA